jgi:glycosyltransferase involved in cell wall biosynthesis
MRVIQTNKQNSGASDHIHSIAQPPVYLETPMQQSEPGINVIGFIRAEMGIGEGCRLAAKSMKAAGLPFGIINYDRGIAARTQDYSWFYKETAIPRYQVNYFHMNADSLLIARQNFGPDLFNNRFNIGYWAWELPVFPDIYVKSFELVQEVWVPSRFVLDAVSGKSPIPVVRIPHAIEIDDRIQPDRNWFGLPKDRFLFLSMYDTHSLQQRKNPQGVIEAFKRAFGPDDPAVGLVLKVNNSNEEEISRLKQIIEENSNIFLLDETMDRAKVNCLLQSVDCYVSLHRSEGFGLVMAEAMGLGKPVIGTNWSGNTDFMNPTNSCTVNYQLKQIGENIGPYQADQIWAEPDIDHAAFYMRSIVRNPQSYRDIGAAGRETIRSQFSPQVVGDMIRNRLSRLGLI